MNPEYIINSIKQISDIHYRDGQAEDRLAYRVGMLESKIRELCAFYEERLAFKENEIKTLMSMVK
jgi:hypothetical protein